MTRVHDEILVALWLVAILLIDFSLWVYGVRFIYQEWPL